MIKTNTGRRVKTTKEIMYEYERSRFYGLKDTMTKEQEAYVEAILTTPIVFSNSKAGTGKTLMAYAALDYLRDQGVIDVIYYVFSPVEEGKMGFRPGTQQEKSLDYSAPIVKAIAAIDGNPFTELDEQAGSTKVVPHTFLRGDTLERAGVIVDEAQNFMTPELRKTLSRLADSCHGVVIGHTGQIDLPDKRLSGFQKYMEHYLTLPSNKVRAVELHKNFRGWISSHADALPGLTTPKPKLEMVPEKG